LREELSIEITTPVHFRVIHHQYPDKRVDLHFFFCSITEGDPRALGCDDFLWVAPSELPKFQFPPADEPLIELLQRLDAGQQ
jgi:hypothetical protein